MNFFTFLWLLWAPLALAFQLPTKPVDDPFYEIPANVSEYEVGEIIAWRPPPVHLRSMVFPLNVKNAWQVQVRSEDSFGEPTSVVTTIIEPYNADPSKILSYLSYVDSPSLDCSPSYAILFGASMDTLPSQFEMTIMDIALSKNWYVVYPDHQGPKAAFTAGLQSGRAILNAIRAALGSGELTGIKPDAKVGLYGYSGGSIASGWAAQIQPNYAPELKSNIVGNAFGGLMANNTETYLTNDGSPFSGLVVAMINGMMQEYPALVPIIEQQIGKKRLKTFYEAKRMCLGATFELYAYEELFKGLDPWMGDGNGFLEIPEIAEIMKNNTLALDEALGVPEMPLFIFQAQNDEVISMNQAQEAYKKWCSWGAPSIEFAVSKYTAHVSEGCLGIGAGFVWLEKRLNGEKPTLGCQMTSRDTNLLYPGADIMNIQFLDTFMRAVLGQKVGEETRNYKESTPISQLFVDVLNGIFTLLGPI